MWKRGVCVIQVGRDLTALSGIVKMIAIATKGKACASENGAFVPLLSTATIADTVRTSFRVF